MKCISLTLCFFTATLGGDKENGVAGHGDTEGHQYTPKLLERLSGKKVVQLSACGFHTGCLTDQGECYTWGEVSEDTCMLATQTTLLFLVSVSQHISCIPTKG